MTILQPSLCQSLLVTKEETTRGVPHRTGNPGMSREVILLMSHRNMAQTCTQWHAEAIPSAVGLMFGAVLGWRGRTMTRPVRWELLVRDTGGLGWLEVIDGG